MRQAVVSKGPFKPGLGRLVTRPFQGPAAKEKPAVIVAYGERVAEPAVTQPELALVIGAPNGVPVLIAIFVGIADLIPPSARPSVRSSR